MVVSILTNATIAGLESPQDFRVAKNTLIKMKKERIKLKNAQTVHIAWKDDSCNAKTSDDGSYCGPAVFIRYIREGESGDDISVKIENEHCGCTFPLSSVTN